MTLAQCNSSNYGSPT